MTKIAWCEKTWNPVVGCTKVSAGCKFCYAEKMAGRLASMGQVKYQHVVKYEQDEWSGEDIVNKTETTFYGEWNGEIYCDESALDKITPRQKPKMIFVSSMGDLFHESVPFEFITKVFKVMQECKQHIFQVLTKRPKRMQEFIGPSIDHLPNLWLGVSAENQEMADKRIPILLQIPATVRFVSLEPLLEEIDLRRLDANGLCCNALDGQSMQHLIKGWGLLDWAIIGAESKGAWPGRECKYEWLYSIKDQCASAGVPAFFKQIPGQGKKLEKDSEVIKSMGWPQEYPKGDIT